MHATWAAPSERSVLSPHPAASENCEGTQVTWLQLGLRGLAETEARETEENQWV